MVKNENGLGNLPRDAERMPEDYWELSHQILLRSHKGEFRREYLQEISRWVLDFSRCDSFELWMYKGKYQFFFKTCRKSESEYSYKEHSTIKDEGFSSQHSDEFKVVEKLCKTLVLKKYDAALPNTTKNGSILLGEVKNPWSFSVKYPENEVLNIPVGTGFQSIAILPFSVDDENYGILFLKSESKEYFTKDRLIFYEGIARTLGIALMHRYTVYALRERIKELSCLLKIGQISADPTASLDTILQSIVDLFPSAWLYPEIAKGRIRTGKKTYTSNGFQEGPYLLQSDLVLNGKKYGEIELFYLSEKPVLDEGPFLKEERHLIDAIARDVSLIIERKQAMEEQEKLQMQLMHADRLATIGQLAAGVAHEINEPLGHVLGYAQLSQKTKDLPEQVQQDLDKIVQISLHAREVIKQLMLFARQETPSKTNVNLNSVIEQALRLFATRFAKNDIDLLRELALDVPEIKADPAQINQILINLIVNSMQAMPNGGKLTIRTVHNAGHLSMIVKDTGIGMSKEVIDQIFMPFFTTKDVDQGTGLGLAVVHGIVQAHKGIIDVESEEGQGTRFEIKFPIAAGQVHEKVI